MAETTTIEWTRNDDGTPGRTWNPVTGCTKISAGCDHCYAETIAERFRGHAAFPHGFDVQIRANKVNDPLNWRKPTRVFANSMSDLFHADIDQAWIQEIFGVMAAARRHTFQLLTKRHARMRSLLNDPAFIDNVRRRAHGKGLPDADWQWPLPNLWLGVSVENQQWADIRIPALIQTPAAVRFLSCEPLLGPVDLIGPNHEGHARDWDGSDYICLDCSTDEQQVPWRIADKTLDIDWLITGGESGRKARPAHPDWFRTLRDQSAKLGIAYFHKQNGEWADRTQLTGDQRATASVWDDKRVLYVHPEDGRTQGHGDFGITDHLEGWATVQRVGKKAAGRELDGREHNAFPAVTR
nr:phage Gp37/Gp68 family protein [Streptomyces canus]